MPRYRRTRPRHQPDSPLPPSCLYIPPSYLHHPSEHHYTRCLLEEGEEQQDGGGKESGERREGKEDKKKEGTKRGWQYWETPAHEMCGWRQREAQCQREEERWMNRERGRKNGNITEMSAVGGGGRGLTQLTFRPLPEPFLFRHYDNVDLYTAQYRFFHTVGQAGRASAQPPQELEVQEPEGQRVTRLTAEQLSPLASPLLPSFPLRLVPGFSRDPLPPPPPPPPHTPHPSCLSPSLSSLFTHSTPTDSLHLKLISSPSFRSPAESLSGRDFIREMTHTAMTTVFALSSFFPRSRSLDDGGNSALRQRPFQQQLGGARSMDRCDHWGVGKDIEGYPVHGTSRQSNADQVRTTTGVEKERDERCEVKLKLAGRERRERKECGNTQGAWQSDKESSPGQRRGACGQTEIKSCCLRPGQPEEVDSRGRVFRGDGGKKEYAAVTTRPGQKWEDKEEEENRISTPSSIQDEGSGSHQAITHDRDDKKIIRMGESRVTAFPDSQGVCFSDLDHTSCSQDENTTLLSALYHGSYGNDAPPVRQFPDSLLQGGSSAMIKSWDKRSSDCVSRAPTEGSVKDNHQAEKMLENLDVLEQCDVSECQQTRSAEGQVGCAVLYKNGSSYQARQPACRVAKILNAVQDMSTNSSRGNKAQLPSTVSPQTVCRTRNSQEHPEDHLSCSGVTAQAQRSPRHDDNSNSSSDTLLGQQASLKGSSTVLGGVDEREEMVRTEQSACSGMDQKVQAVDTPMRTELMSREQVTREESSCLAVPLLSATLIAQSDCFSQHSEGPAEFGLAIASQPSSASAHHPQQQQQQKEQQQYRGLWTGIRAVKAAGTSRCMVHSDGRACRQLSEVLRGQNEKQQQDNEAHMVLDSLNVQPQVQRHRDSQRRGQHDHRVTDLIHQKGSAFFSHPTQLLRLKNRQVQHADTSREDQPEWRLPRIVKQDTLCTHDSPAHEVQQHLDRYRCVGSRWRDSSVSGKGGSSADHLASVATWTLLTELGTEQGEALAQGTLSLPTVEGPLDCRDVGLPCEMLRGVSCTRPLDGKPRMRPSNKHRSGFCLTSPDRLPLPNLHGTTTSNVNQVAVPWKWDLTNRKLAPVRSSKVRNTFLVAPSPLDSNHLVSSEGNAGGNTAVNSSVLQKNTVKSTLPEMKDPLSLHDTVRESSPQKRRHSPMNRREGRTVFKLSDSTAVNICSAVPSGTAGKPKDTHKTKRAHRRTHACVNESQKAWKATESTKVSSSDAKKALPYLSMLQMPSAGSDLNKDAGKSAAVQVTRAGLQDMCVRKKERCASWKAGHRSKQPGVQSRQDTSHARDTSVQRKRENRLRLRSKLGRPCSVSSASSLSWSEPSSSTSIPTLAGRSSSGPHFAGDLLHATSAYVCKPVSLFSHLTTPSTQPFLSLVPYSDDVTRAGQGEDVCRPGILLMQKFCVEDTHTAVKLQQLPFDLSGKMAPCFPRRSCRTLRHTKRNKDTPAPANKAKVTHDTRQSDRPHVQTSFMPELEKGEGNWYQQDKIEEWEKQVSMESDVGHMHIVPQHTVLTHCQDWNFNGTKIPAHRVSGSRDPTLTAAEASTIRDGSVDGT